MSPPVVEATTEVRERIRHRARHNRTGSGNFHPLTQKAKLRLARAGEPRKALSVSKILWDLDKRGILARLDMVAEGWQRSSDPTAWDALIRVIKEGY